MLPLALGCRGPWSGSTKLPATMPAPEASGIRAAATEQPPPQSEEAALAEILDELSEIDAIDPAAKQLLMADLRQADRENWPLIVQQFRSALAYRQQLAEREQGSTENQFAAKQVSAPNSDKIAQRAAEQRVAKEMMAKEMTSTLLKTSPVSQTPAQSVALQTPPALPQEPLAQPTATVISEPAAPPLNALRAAPSATQILSAPPRSLVGHASFVSSADSSLDWRQHLQNSIAALQTNVQPTPGSTDEVNEHMRLRLLQLLAGDKEAALAPIPGATAGQQDYWNQQLFAVSTFLDSEQQPNDKQRAAGALLHLDQARANLSELATLQVRKLAFVDSVAGYGAYELHEAKTFHPGEQVTLYAEIENFSSQSTKQGYRTLLGTSYEVVDENGKRIDNAQFPEVEDLCQNPRRDFHMQYTVTLPTRLPADNYELRLIITDEQSHKIGQASLPFEIAE